jgi:hypothetical protein
MGNMVRERKQQIKIALSDDTRAALELLASKTGSSLAAEVRDLVSLGLHRQLNFDQKTNGLAHEVTILARDVAAVSNGVAWHEHPAVHAALAEAIAVAMASVKPSSSEKSLPPDYEPRAVGATVARMRMLKSEEITRFTDDMRKNIAEFELGIGEKMEQLTRALADPKQLRELIKHARTKQKPRKKSNRKERP